MNEVQIGRFYTGARKFKQLIGVFPDGTQIWGGPYTVTQFVLALVVAVVGFGSRSIGLWGGNLIIDAFYVIVVAAAAGFGVGKLPVSRRSLVHMTSSVFDLLLVDSTGYWKGQKIPTHLVPPKKPANTQKREQTEEQPAAAALEDSLSAATTENHGGGLARIRAAIAANDLEGSYDETTRSPISSTPDVDLAD